LRSKISLRLLELGLGLLEGHCVVARVHVGDKLVCVYGLVFFHVHGFDRAVNPSRNAVQMSRT